MMYAYIARCVLICNLVHQCIGAQLYFASCGRGGMSCVTAPNNKINFTINCNAETGQDVTIHIWAFRSPANIGNLTIQNCETLRLNFQCTGEAKFIPQLTVVNITNLYLAPAVFSHVPQITTFKNISNIPFIPKELFSQLLKRSYRPGCSAQGYNLNNLTFADVTIGTIETHAFMDLTNFDHFVWDNVTVVTMQTNALKIDLNKNAAMSIRNGRIEMMEHLSFQITGERAFFVGNHFGDVHASAINGTIGNFNFDGNTIGKLQPGALCLLSQNVHVTNNKFNYLQSGALQKISPGLLYDSKANFGMLRFVYEFVKNEVVYADVGGLNPDIAAYDNVATKIIFEKNILWCSCEKLGWVVIQTGLGHSHGNMRGFYRDMLSESNKNVCAFTSCKLPLNTLTKIYEKCLNGVIYRDYCDARNRTPPKVIQIEYSQENGTTEELTIYDNASYKLTCNALLVMAVLIFAV